MSFRTLYCRLEYGLEAMLITAKEKLRSHGKKIK